MVWLLLLFHDLVVADVLIEVFAVGHGLVAAVVPRLGCC